MAISTTDELRIQFWWAIRKAAPEQWRALADGGPAGLEVWLSKNHLTYQGQPAAWCRALAVRQINSWRDVAEEKADDRDVLDPIAFPGVVVRPIPREACVFELEVWGWRPDLMASEAVYGAVTQPDKPGMFVGESRQEAKKRIERAFRAKLEAHLDAVEELLKEAGAREKRQPQHVLWLAEWQVARWNAAEIFRMLPATRK